MKIRNILSFVLLIISISSYTQVGSIVGVIKDGQSGEPVIGAVVKVVGTNKATEVDFDGNYKIDGVMAGVYTLQVELIGYETKVLNNVIVRPNEESSYDIKMGEDPVTLEVVNVVAQRKSDTDRAVLSEIKNLSNIAAGVSSQQIAKMQDRDASQVARRIPGVSIFDDRFVIIRGLSDRYNNVLINDIIAASTEVDVKSFSFDLLPSTIIDRMLIYKSPSADLPGDIAGGAVKIYTKSVVDDEFLNVGVGLGIRQYATGSSVLSHQGSSFDILGFGNYNRQLPSSFPTTKTVIDNAKSISVINAFSELNPYYELNQINVMPDMRASINYAKNYKIGGRKLSHVGTVTYNISNALQEKTQNRFLYNQDIQSSFLDKQFNQNVRLAAMSNFGLHVNKNHNYDLRIFFNQLAVKETTQRTGNILENQLEINNGAFRYEQRSLLTTTVGGHHVLNKKHKLNWNTGANYTVRKEPDFRRYTSSRAMGSEEMFNINLQSFESPTLQQAARFFSDMDEYTVTATLNGILTLKENVDENDNTNLNYGLYSDYKDRYFKARWFGIVNPNRMSTDFTSQAPEIFFNADNLGPQSVYYTEGTNFDDKYTAQNNLNAAYTSVNGKISSKIYYNVGLRAEYNSQNLQSRERGGGQKVDVSNNTLNVLPSANLQFKFNTKNIIRVAYANTLNRPEFRELAPFTYYDFGFDVSRRGNKDIKSASIHNFDIRYDLYMKDGEMLTIGTFYKRFINPIEASIFYNGSTVAFTVANANSAVSQGVELELRKNITDNLSFLCNAAVINSSVKVSGQTELSRYLQGQSPYIVNTGLFYQYPSQKISINLMYNIIGPRIYVIGDNVLSSHVYEMPRNVIDFNISKKWKNIEVKLGAQDLLNQSVRLIQDTDRNNKITSSDGVFQSYKPGSSAFISFSYNLGI
jgi:hypothetical protein